MEECVGAGGRITTEQVGDNQYRSVCTIEGKSFYGRTRDKQTSKQKRRTGLRARSKRDNKRSSLKGT